MVADVSARTFAFIGNCRFPLYVTPALARERFGAWKSINERRTERQGWPFATTLGDMPESQPTLKLLWAIVGRNQDRARRHYLRACTAESDRELDARADGEILLEPPNDEAAPAEPVGQ